MYAGDKIETPYREEDKMEMYNIRITKQNLPVP